MSKIVCDICGTSYAESENQCPICGTAKTEASRPASGSDNGYAYVKGGRFSQSNVRKHNSGKADLPRTPAEEKPVPPKPVEQKPADKKPTEQKPIEQKPAEKKSAEQKPAEKKPAEQNAPKVAPAKNSKARPAPRPRRQEPENEQPSNIGLIIIVVVLLVAIIAVCAYIGIYAYDKYSNKATEPNNSTSSSTSQPVEVPCTGISVSGGITSHNFDALGQEWMVEIICEPAGTTDLLQWDYDESIVSVEANGNYWIISPVGKGETVITVSCGAYSTTLTVISDPADVPCSGISISGPTSHTFTSSEPLRVDVVWEPDWMEYEVTWEYNQEIISIAQDGEQWVITPLASGATTATVTCGEYSASISITVDLEDDFVLEWACNSDISLSGYGTRWRIYNGSVDVANITFTSSNEEVATVKDGYVYIWKNGTATITASYGNQTITMIVRANNVEETVQTEFYLAHQYDTENTASDVTIAVGEKLTFSLRDKDGAKITEGVTFSISAEGYFTVDENGRVTGVAANLGMEKMYLLVEYQGVVYKCIIRVKPAA